MRDESPHGVARDARLVGEHGVRLAPREKLGLDATRARQTTQLRRRRLAEGVLARHRVRVAAPLPVSYTHLRAHET